MSKNKDAKRKAKIKAQKAQAAQQAQARNEHRQAHNGKTT